MAKKIKDIPGFTGLKSGDKLFSTGVSEKKARQTGQLSEGDKQRARARAKAESRRVKEKQKRSGRSGNTIGDLAAQASAARKAAKKSLSTSSKKRRIQPIGRVVKTKKK